MKKISTITLCVGLLLAFVSLSERSIKRLDDTGKPLHGGKFNHERAVRDARKYNEDAVIIENKPNGFMVVGEKSVHFKPDGSFIEVGPLNQGRDNEY